MGPVGFASTAHGAAWRRTARPAIMRANGGFTLLELLVVVTIVGITLGMVSFNAMPSNRKSLQNDAQRVALLLQLARDEAIVRDRPVAFDADSNGYRFLVRQDDGSWQPISGDDMMRERDFKLAPLGLAMNPQPVDGGNSLRIIFGREPVNKPFVLTMSAGNDAVAIRADGVGHFAVE